jgi:hypothetical protein
MPPSPKTRLSSQGLAASLSDALYAVAAIMSGSPDNLRLRQAENLSAHLAYLKEQLMRCRYYDSPLWSAYERFISETTADDIENQVALAIRHSRLEAHLLGSSS